MLRAIMAPVTTNKELKLACFRWVSRLNEAHWDIHTEYLITEKTYVLYQRIMVTVYYYLRPCHVWVKNKKSSFPDKTKHFLV